MIHVAPLLLALTCAMASEAVAPPSLVAGRLADPLLSECSGVVASRVHPGVLWAHNDSGNRPDLFAIGADGSTLARFAVAADNVDWEDIAVGPGGIYLADVGNNRRARREVRVLGLDEPDPALPAGAPLAVRSTTRLTFPGEPFDCEALVIAGEIGYLIDKRLDGRPGLWRFRLDAAEAQVLERVATLPIHAPVTGADLTVDGRRLAVCHPLGLHVFALPPGALEDVIAAAPSDYLGWLDPNQEACCFVPGGVLAIAESRAIRWISDQRLAAGGGEFPVPIAVEVRPAPAGFAVDGDLTEWADANAIPLASAPGAGSARAWVGWTAAGMVVAGDVSGIAPGPESTPWYAGDAVEVFLGSESPGRPPEYTATDDRCYLAVVDGTLALRWPRRPTVPESARAAGALRPDGYTFEALVPAAAPLAADGTVRFALSILARQPRRNWYQPTANAGGVWLSPLNWAVARLLSADGRSP